jgi:uncharacterized protein (DUF58 family)
MIQPTRRAVLIFSAGVPVSLFVVIQYPTLWALSFCYGAAVLLAMAADAALAFPQRLLSISVIAPDRIYIGERGTVTAVIAPTLYPRVTRFDLLSEQRGDLAPAEVIAIELPVGGEARAAIPVVPWRRGKVSIDRLWVRWLGPLLLVQLTRTVAVERSMDVLPNVRGVQSALLQFFAKEAIFGIKVQRQKGAGTEFEALRDYAPGLDNRFIDWKRSARHRKLLCKEFETERNHQIILAFDTGYLMLEPLEAIPRLDHAINVGLLLAWISLRGGDFVGIYGFDAAVRHYLQPIRGTSGFARIQRVTAQLDYHHEETNFTLGLAELNTRLRRRALVILFTDFVDTVTAELLIEGVGRVANRHVVLFVTLRGSFLQQTVDQVPERFTDIAEAVVAHDFLRDRSIVFEKLERLGVHCLDVPYRNLAIGLINRYLLIKERGLI